MRLARQNYYKALPLIYKALGQSNYIAIDFEFSGHMKDVSLTNSRIDTFEDRYWKQRTAIQSYLPLQLGITGIQATKLRENEGIEVATLYPFNIPLLPFGIEEKNTCLPDKYCADVAALEFLCANSFDFNQTFNDGVPYVSEANLMTLRKAETKESTTTNIHKRPKKTTPQQGTKKEQRVIKEMKEDYIDLFEGSQLLAAKFSAEGSKACALQDERHTKLVRSCLKAMSSKERMAKFELSESIDDLAAYVHKDNNNKDPFLMPDFLGVTNIIRYMSMLGRPLIVHNGMLDLMLLHKEFIGPLPEDLADYKASLRNHFPLIYDTKHMAGTLASLYVENPNSQLSELYGKFLAKSAAKPENVPKISVHPAFSAYNLKSKATHEAGFDSMMTGAVFSNFLDQICGTFIGTLAEEVSEQYCKNRLPISGSSVPLFLEDTKKRPCGQEEVFVAAGGDPAVTQSAIVDALKAKYNTKVKISKLFKQNVIFFTMLNAEENGKLRQSLKETGYLSFPLQNGKDEAEAKQQFFIATHGKYMEGLKGQHREQYYPHY